MYEVTVLNLKSGVSFVRNFTSPYLAQKFINKCKRSKTVRVIATSGILVIECTTRQKKRMPPSWRRYMKIQHSLSLINQLEPHIVDANHTTDGELTIVFLSLYLKRQTIHLSTLQI